MFNTNKYEQLMSDIGKGTKESLVDTEDSEGPGYEIRAATFVIQKYIERPFLIHGRKFDIRVWMLVTQNKKVYFCREGYIRTSGEAFTLDTESVEKRSVHLTNSALQKYSQAYGKYEDGNQMSFSDLDSYVEQQGMTKKVKGELTEQIKEAMVITVMSIREKLLSMYDHNRNCFELFGFDFILDEDL